MTKRSSRGGLGEIEGSLPVVVLFCDVAGLGEIVEEHGVEWAQVFPRYQEVVWAAIDGAGGCVEDGETTSFFGSFDEPVGALRAACEIQRGLAVLDVPDGLEIRARVGVHAGVLGETISRNVHSRPQFQGLDVHRGARVRGAARPGQVIVSGAVRDLVSLGERFIFEDLGFHRLRDFPESVRLFNLVVFDDHRAEFFGPPDTLDYRPTNLTADDRPLLGRNDLIEAVRSAFLDDHHRLVTLTGPGGVGKTRVAIAAGGELLDESRGGVWLIRAETLKRAEQLLPAIAVVLDVRDVPGKSLFDAIVARVEFSPMLLVVDNLEQLTGVADTISELIDRTTSLRILATSQTPLRISCETVLQVPMLPLDDAVEWFRLGARSAGTTLDLDNQKVKKTVEDLVESLNRLPLTIELAAAQLRNLTLSQLAEGIKSQLELPTLEPDKPERQQSLTAIINWSVNALPPQAQTLFTRLGVFTGITTLELIEEVCSKDIDVLDAAATLVDYSLLRRVDIGFGMPPSVQQTAAQLLANSDEQAELRRLHAITLTRHAARIDIHKMTPEIAREGRALDANLMSAVNWARTADEKLYVEMVVNLAGWWRLLGRMKSGLKEIATALNFNFISRAQRAKLLNHRVTYFYATGSPEKALADATESLKLVGTDASIERGNCLISLSMATYRSDLDASATIAADAAQIFRGLDRPDRLTSALLMQSQALLKAGHADDAAGLLDEASAIALSQQTYASISGLPNVKGDWALATNKPLAALESYATALQGSSLLSRSQELFDITGIVFALWRLGEHQSVIELSGALEIACRDFGLNFDYLFARPYCELLKIDKEWSDGVLRTAHDGLSNDQVTDAQTRGKELSGGQLTARALAITNRVLEKHGVLTIQ